VLDGAAAGFTGPAIDRFISCRGSPPELPMVFCGWRVGPLGRSAHEPRHRPEQPSARTPARDRALVCGAAHADEPTGNRNGGRAQDSTSTPARQADFSSSTHDEVPGAPAANVDTIVRGYRDFERFVGA
jgi:hypothetical protein